MKRTIYALVLLLLTVSAFAYVYIPPLRQYPMYSPPVRQYSWNLNSYPTREYAAPPTLHYPAFGGCNSAIVADPTSNSFLEVASKECRENNLDEGCYNSCMRKARDLYAKARARNVECRYVENVNFEGLYGSSACRRLTLDCPILNSGLARQRFCSEQCKEDVYKQCQSIGTTRSTYAPREEWSMFLRTERALPILKTVAYPYRGQ